MVFKGQLTRDQFVRISILRHFQRKQFYFYAITCAVVTVFAITQELLILLVLAWLPFLLYIGIGVFGAIRGGSDPNHPVYLLTTYKITDAGVLINNEQTESQLGWDQFAVWKKAIQCYILELKSGVALVIPQAAVPINQKPKFETLLNRHIG